MAHQSKKEIRPTDIGPVKLVETKRIVSSRLPGVSWRIVLQALVITAAALWIYWPVLHGDWLWDDGLYLTGNPLMHDPHRLWKAWFEPGSWVEYYPIEETVQWFQWHLWGMNTLGYHLTNVLLHILNALLVWRLLGKFGLRLAWLGGLIFAIHPVQVESVAWIAELKNTLSLPPFLLAMCAWIDYDEHGKSSDYFLALGLFLVAMLCKITMAPFPVMILLYAWWKRGRINRHDILASAPFWLISFMLGLIAIWAGQHYLALNHDTAEPIALGGVFSRLACAGLSLSFYFSKCFLPVDLIPIYPKWTIDPASFWQFLPWLVLGAAIYWFWTKRSNWGRHALLGLGFFVIFLAPFLGFNAISYMAFTWVMDHFLYIPMIGLIGLFVAALGEMEKRAIASFQFCGMGLAIVILTFLALESRTHAKVFLNEEALWAYTVRHNSGAWLAHNSLGYALYEKGRLPEAMEQYQQALQIRPDYAEAHNNLGLALFETGRMPEAMEQCEQALRIRPDYAEARNNLGNVLLQTGHLAEAMEQYRQALQTKPDYVLARNGLGNALRQSGRLTEAMEQFEQILQIQPDYAPAHNNLGDALQQSGRLAEAMEQYQQALQVKPDYPEAHYNMGNLLFETGRSVEAMEQYQQALQIKSDYAEAHKNLGAVLFQVGRLSESMEQFQQALQIDPNDAETHYDLGNVLLQTDRVSEAIEQYHQALQLKPDFADARKNLALALQLTTPAKN